MMSKKGGADLRIEKKSRKGDVWLAVARFSACALDAREFEAKFVT